jgi:hypothetical protein
MTLAATRSKVGEGQEIRCYASTILTIWISIHSGDTRGNRRDTGRIFRVVAAFWERGDVYRGKRFH